MTPLAGWLYRAWNAEWFHVMPPAGTAWTLLRRARTAVGTCVVWVNA